MLKRSSSFLQRAPYSCYDGVGFSLCTKLGNTVKTLLYSSPFAALSGMATILIQEVETSNLNKKIE